MFLQRRVVPALSALAIENVLEVRVSIDRRPVAFCKASEQEEGAVKNQSEQ